MRRFLFAFLTLTLASAAWPSERPGDLTQPDHFAIGRHTFFDFGPPSNYYELYIVRPAAGGSSIERITLTPPGEEVCRVPPGFESKVGFSTDSPAALLGPTNPCAIPEAELKQELKRCKDCQVFSGADVAMQVQCGSDIRLIRSAVLDRDMFDSAVKTPEHTSWTMNLLDRLDQTVGPGLMERPVFTIPTDERPQKGEPKSATLEGISQGMYDGLFPGAPDKLSDLYRAAQNAPPPPTVRLLQSEPFSPESLVEPTYPPIARMAHLEGTVTLTAMVDESGKASTLRIESGHPLLRGAVEEAVKEWVFPKEAIGHEVRATVAFSLNCPK